MGAERIVFIVSDLSNDLVRVVTLHAAVVTSGSLSYLMGSSAEGRPLQYKD
jgi:hypothetical protein